jgi:hypothetical protein
MEFRDSSLLVSARMFTMVYRKTNLERAAAEISKIQVDLLRLDRRRALLQRRLMTKIAMFNKRYVQTADDQPRKRPRPSATTLHKIRQGVQRRWGLPPGMPTVKEIRAQRGCTWGEARLMQRRLAAEQKRAANPS